MIYKIFIKLGSWRALPSTILPSTAETKDYIRQKGIAEKFTCWLLVLHGDQKWLFWEFISLNQSSNRFLDYIQVPCFDKKISIINNMAFSYLTNDRFQTHNYWVPLCLTFVKVILKKFLFLLVWVGIPVLLPTTFFFPVWLHSSHLDQLSFALIFLQYTKM